MKSPLVSIIIPVYNAYLQLAKCLSSIKEQKYLYTELIFVNDCSQDLSRDLLERFKEEFESLNPLGHVKIIDHPVNMGVAAARNSGLDVVTGEYIYYLDADDYLDRDCIETLVTKAIESKADIVGCDWVLQFEQNGRVMKQPAVKSGSQAIEYMSKRVMRWNLWIFLVKSKLYFDHGIRFIPGQNMGEDMMVMFKLFSLATSIEMIAKPLYFYAQSNQQSISKIYSERHKMEVVNNLSELDCYFRKKIEIENWNILFNLLKLNIKLPLLISNDSRQYKEWMEWFPEANSYSLKNELISHRIKWVQYMASKKQYWFVKIHYYIIIRVVYGLLYR